MPAKEIKELRQAGKLEDAYVMAKAELEADLSNIWGKRNLSWVLYAQLDEFASNLDAFIAKINEVKELDLPASEEMFFENLSIVISKAARVITHEPTMDISKIHRLFDSIKGLTLKRNSKWFSVLFNAMHKGMKESSRYIEFADWWDFKNFMTVDFEKDKLPDGKEVMAIAEQAYIVYTKHLLPKHSFDGDLIFDKEKAIAFLPILAGVVESYPAFQYPAYFYAKLLLALGDKDKMLNSILPFARKKQNDFWVWGILAEAFPQDTEKVFSCYCKALSCKSPEEMLVSLRQKMASILISKMLFAEAKTEIELLVKAREEHKFKIPSEVLIWQDQSWYKNASAFKSNINLYTEHLLEADAILFSDFPEELLIVEFVNSDKRMLNFIASESKFGFFKYDRFLKDVKIGDVLKVRFRGGSKEGMHQIYSARKVIDDAFKVLFMKETEGQVRIKAGQAFGFVEDVYVHPSIVSWLQLADGSFVSGQAIKTFNKEKCVFSWKLIIPKG